VIFLQVKNEKNTIKNNKINTRVLPLDSSYISRPKINLSYCPAIKNNEEVIIFGSGSNKSIINLDDIEIKNDYKKEKLTHKEGNSIAKSYKIGETEFGTLLGFLDKNGYRTGFYTTDNSVYIKNRQSDIVRTMAATPTLYIDNLEVLDLNFFSI